MNHDTPSFDPKKHDAKITARGQAEFAALQREVMAKVYRAYNQKKVALMTKRQCTTADVNRFLYDLEQIVHENCKHPALKEWVEFTIDMLEAKIGAVIATDILKRNLFTPYLGRLPLPNPQAPAVLSSQPKSCCFDTLEDFLAIPEVAVHVALPNFAGLALDGCMVLALLGPKKHLKVGSVANGVGLDKLPSLLDMERAWAQAHNGKPMKKGQK